MSLPMDPALPDLLPEGSLFDDIFPSENPSVTVTHPDIVALNSRLDHLSLETNTQALRIKVERAKRQRLSATVRQVKQNMLLSCPDIASLKDDVEVMQGNQNAINYQLEGEITNMNVMTFRCLSRMHQIITFLLSHVMLPPDNNFELTQMLHELSRTLQQFRVDYSVSYV